MRQNILQFFASPTDWVHCAVSDIDDFLYESWPPLFSFGYRCKCCDIVPRWSSKRVSIEFQCYIPDICSYRTPAIFVKYLIQILDSRLRWLPKFFCEWDESLYESAPEVLHLTDRFDEVKVCSPVESIHSSNGHAPGVTKHLCFPTIEIPEYRAVHVTVECSVNEGFGATAGVRKFLH